MTSADSAITDQGSRHLLTGVVSQYIHSPSWNREELSGNLDRIVELFKDFGYTHNPVLGLDPTGIQLKRALRSFCAAKVNPDDYVVVYLAGHGDILPVGDAGSEHVLLPADTDPRDLRGEAVKSSDLAEWILAETPVRRLMLLVDACYSGQAGLDFSRNALARMGTPDRLTSDGSGVVVITSTRPRQQAITGAFTAALERAIRGRAVGGYGVGTLGIEAVMSVLETDRLLPATQQPQWSMLGGSGRIPDFLPNPRRDATMVDLDLAEQDRRWQEHLKQRETRRSELLTQFMPRIDKFTGRHRALIDITNWLSSPADTKPVIVTGDPGSGKTTVLALLAALADPKRRPTVPRNGLPANGIPAEHSIDAVIYAGNLTSGQILAGLGSAVRIDGIDPRPGAIGASVTHLLSELRRRAAKPIVVMIDALDEASEPVHLAEQLLCPLIDRGRGLVRLLLGTRRYICDHLGRDRRAQCMLIDLDGAEYSDPVALSAFIRNVLVNGGPVTVENLISSPFRNCSAPDLDEATIAVAEAAGSSFFVARILASTLALGSSIPDLADPVWRAKLPSEAGPAMRHDLVTRLGEHAQQAIDLLTPLAYAQGSGLPWEDIWAMLANALAPGRQYTNEELLDLASHAGSFIVEAGAIQGRSLYRMYHRLLAENLTHGRDQTADQRVIVRTLTADVPRSHDGGIDWPAAHPYIRAHLATHAAHSGDIDDLAQDPGFLLAADPPQLLAALDAAGSLPARAAGDAYHGALPLIRRRPEAEHAAYLGLAARCGRAEALAARIDEAGPGSPWRARWASWQLQRSHHRLAGHLGWVRSVAVAELDGSPVVISGSDDGTVRVWDLASGAAVGRPITGHEGWVRSVAVAELDGSPIVISGDDRAIRAWHLGSRDPVGIPLRDHRGPVNAIAAVKLEGRTAIVSGGDDRTLRVWDLVNGVPVGGPFQGHEAAINAVAVAELDGRPVAISGSADQTVRVWDLERGVPLGDPLTGHVGWVRSVAVAELDRRTVVISGGTDRSVRVWDLATRQPVGDPFVGHTGWVRSVAVAELDRRPVVVSGSIDKTVQVWDLASGAPVGDPFTGHVGWVRSVAVAELDNRPMVISGSDDESIRIWDMAAGTLMDDPFAGHAGPVNTVATAEVDGIPVAISGSGDRTVRVWSLQTGELVGDPFTGHAGPVNAVTAADLDGHPVVVSGGDDHTIRVWDPAIGAAIGRPFTGHEALVTAVAATKVNGQSVIISGSGDRTVRVWDLASGMSIGRPFTGHSGWVRSVAVAQLNGRNVVITGSGDRTIQVWDLATRALVCPPLTGHAGTVNAVAVAEIDGRPVIISGSGDLTVRVWDLGTGAPIGRPFTGHSDLVTTVNVAYLNGRPIVVSGSGDATFRAWDLLSRAPVPVPFTGYAGWVRSTAVAYLNDRPVVVASTGDEGIHVWELGSGSLIKGPFNGHTGAVSSIAVTELRGRLVTISGSADQTVRVRDLKMGTLISPPFAGHSDSINSVAPAALDGRPVVISGSTDRTVRISDLATGSLVADPFTGHSGSVNSVVAAELGGRLVVVSGSSDQTVRVWDLATGSLVAGPFTGHSGSVNSVVAAELGGRLVVVSGSSDQTVRVWDLATGSLVAGPFTGHSGSVNSVVAAELGGRLVVVSGSSDQTVRVWDPVTGTEAAERFVSQAGPIRSIDHQVAQVAAPADSANLIAIGAGNTVAVSTAPSLNDRLWRRVVVPEFNSAVLSVRWVSRRALAVGTELGVVVVDVFQ